MRTVTTYAGRTLEFLDLKNRVLHLKPRQTLELEESELEEIKQSYPDIFARLFVHGFTPNQKEKIRKSQKVTKSVTSSESRVKKPGRPKTKDLPKDKSEKSDPSKS